MSNNEEEILLQRIALTMIPKVGCKGAKNLISYIGSVEGIFNSSTKSLKAIPGIGSKLAGFIQSKKYFARAEQELKFIRKNNIQPIFYLDKKYPARLKDCEDSPILLYFKGEFSFNQQKIISVVGTRQVTSYGISQINNMVEGLAAYDPCIISGLAYGVDIYTHRAALNNKLKTIGVLGHGLDTIYPAQHKLTANQMVKSGGLLTEFHSESFMDKDHFPRRNRIIAGISDATIVIETGARGGSMITAYQAHSYNRTIFAIPGKVTDKLSIGCNKLIKRNMAILYESPDDIIEELGWENKQKENIQRSVFVELNEEEKHLIEIFGKDRILHIDEINKKSSYNYSLTASTLLSLEMKACIKKNPGSLFEIML